MRKNKAFEQELDGLLNDSSQEKEDQSENKTSDYMQNKRSSKMKSMLMLKVNRLRVSGKEEEKRKYIAHLNDLINYCERMNGTAKENPETIGKYLKASMILRNEIARLEK